MITGTEDGSVFRVQPDGAKIERLGQTGGRPLGLELLPDGRILVCDAKRGLIALDPTTGRVEDPATQFQSARCGSAITLRWPVRGDLVLRHQHPLRDRSLGSPTWSKRTPSARLFRRDVDGQVTQVLDGLHFANGAGGECR